MGTFDAPSDAPFQIKTEGETITIKFLPGKPQHGQGTVQWNLPVPARGCQVGDGVSAYCGMVVVLDTSPIGPNQTPQNGTIYESDNVANRDLHAGDKIGTGLVIGAFYEGEKKSREEQLTTEFIVNNLDPRQPYYVVGFAVDCQLRYHLDGQRAYSAEFGNVEEPGTPGTHTVLLGENGVSPSDGTGLTPGFIYELEIMYNDGNRQKIVKFSEDGINLGTYNDLVESINNTLNQSDMDTVNSPVPPNQGRYYYNGDLYQWDGTENQPVDFLKEATDPSIVGLGTYWFEPSSHVLQLFSGSPLAWNVVSEIEYHKDPTTLSGGGDYWFNGSSVYSWCATTWCLEDLISSSIDPTLPSTPDCSVYWFNPDTTLLQNWNRDTEQWEQVFALEWTTDPNSLVVGTYWYNDTSSVLSQWDGAIFNVVPHVTSTDEPVAPVDNDLWFNPTAEELKQWTDTTMEWLDLDVLIWLDDPTDTQSCDLWWNTTTDTLFKWDVVHSEWDQVAQFIQNTTDPFADPIIEVGQIWFNPTTEVMMRWDGIRWSEIPYIDYPTDPTIPTTGTAWHNTTTDTWSIWGLPVAGWNAIDPINSPNNPTIIPNGTLWYNTTNNTLYERSGVSWLVTPFSTAPFYPTNGDTWYDTTNNILMEWVRNPDRDVNDPTSQQGSWEPTSAPVQVMLDDNGNLTLYTTTGGSGNYALFVTPADANYGRQLATGHAGSDALCCASNEELNHGYVSSIMNDTYLFAFLPDIVFTYHLHGVDSVSSLPTYDQLGVGDDGTPDERRELATSIREQLGYPVVDVELTTKQIDTAIDQAIEVIRQRTSLAYERAMFFLDIKPGIQHYDLTDKTCGFHTVVTVMSAYRMTSAFLSSAHGSGVYGQVVLQHLYNMGTFDLLSYHLVSEYVEQLEHLFATRLVYHWNETSRRLSFYQAFSLPERVLLDVMVERTEQNIMRDRWAKNWIERYAYMRSLEMLSQIRGKFASLPGAGGGVTLNASDLKAEATEIREQLMADIDDFVVNDVEDIGLHSTVILG